MTVIMMVVGKHAVDALADKERRLAVRDFFRRLRQRHAYTAHARDVFFTGVGFSLSQRLLFHGGHSKTLPRIHGEPGQVNTDKTNHKNKAETKTIAKNKKTGP